MNSKYYIRSNKIYKKYRRRKCNRRRALRKEEVIRSKYIKSALILLLASLICLTLILVTKNYISNNGVKTDSNVDYNISSNEDVNISNDTDLENNDINEVNGSTVINNYDDIGNKELNEYEEINTNIDDIKKTKYAVLQEMDLPDTYYRNIDFSSFQPYMSYEKITNENSPAYGITHDPENSYTDENGFRRYKTSNDQLTVNGKDDYIVALGTFYKKKGTAGSRFLVETTTGKFTIITGEEKSDENTDEMNMFTWHKNGTAAGVIEWLVDENKICSDIIESGTVTEGPIEEIHGEIIHIYKIL